MNQKDRLTIAEDLVRLLPTQPSDAAAWEIKERLEDKNALVYKMLKQNSTVEYRCTACGARGEGKFISGTGRGYYAKKWGFIEHDDIGHPVEYRGDNVGICPRCGENVSIRKIGKNDSAAFFYGDNFLTVHVIKGYITIICWRINKIADMAGCEHYTFHGCEAVAFIGGGSVRFVKWTATFNGGSRFIEQWEVRKKYTDIINECGRRKVIDVDAVEYETYKRSALDLYIVEGEQYGDILPVQYMRIYSKYPCIENLTRQGYSDKITEIIGKTVRGYGYYYEEKYRYCLDEIKKYIDLKKAKPHEIFRLEKDEMHLIREVDIEDLALWTEIREKRGIKMDAKTLEIARGLRDEGVQLEDFLLDNNMSKFFPVAHTINYLGKQYEDHSVIRGNYYGDYLRMMKAVYGDLRLELLFPKNLVEMHDRMTELYNQKQDEILCREIAAANKKRMVMAWTDEETGLMIRPAASQSELVQEGKNLHHCVASYTKAHASGETNIFFIRRISAPDVSYFTLEWKEEHVVQNRGNHNCQRTPEVVIFEKKWLEYLKTLNKKEKSKNGRKQNAAGRVGA